MNYKYNEEQEIAHTLDAKNSLKEYLGKQPKEISSFYNYVEKRGRKEAKNKIYSIFFLRKDGKNDSLTAINLTDKDDVLTPKDKHGMRELFKTFIPQILKLTADMGFDCAIRDKVSKNTITNFNPEDEDDNEDDFWKEKVPQ